MVQEVVIKILNQCNWSCEYCDNTGDKIVPIEKVIMYINKLQELNPNITLSFTGGEPGLLTESYLTKMFNAIKNPCEIATNGTFLKNKYHLLFKDKIKNFSYHVTPKIEKNLKVKLEDTNGIESRNIIIVNKQNINILSQFLKTNKEIIFNIKFYVGVDKDLLLDNVDIINLKNITELNIDKTSKTKILNFIIFWDNLDKARNICQNEIFVPRIDLLKDKIYRCCAGNTNSTDSGNLNDLMLKLIFKHNIFYKLDRLVCKNCLHNFVNHFIGE